LPDAICSPKDVIDLIDNDALDALVNSRVPRENFGPGSDRTCLALILDGTDAAHTDWLMDLPCPVVGIGAGALAQACDVVLPDEIGLDGILKNIAKTPIAAMILVQNLRASETLGLKDALTAESLAYAAVQRGPEFLQWLEGYSPPSKNRIDAQQPLLLEINDNKIALMLNDPDNLNAIGVQMRDALCEA